MVPAAQRRFPSLGAAETLPYHLGAMDWVVLVLSVLLAVYAYMAASGRVQLNCCFRIWPASCGRGHRSPTRSAQRSDFAARKRQLQELTRFFAAAACAVSLDALCARQQSVAELAGLFPKPPVGQKFFDHPQKNQPATPGSWLARFSEKRQGPGLLRGRFKDKSSHSIRSF